ncbi:MAG: hypothetical protein NTU41_08715 [Chloroflexi bacterium]|nr:hypothetical protein [Chloroflexota bacterium]
MDKVEKGKYIISAAKSLKRYRVGDRTVAALLYATSYAGRAGLLASAVRFNKSLSLDRLVLLGAEEGFLPQDVTSHLLPWLVDSGLCRTITQSGQVSKIESLILTYNGMLKAVAALYDSQHPSLEDNGCLLTLEIASRSPTAESDVIHQVALEIGEQKAKVAVNVAESYKIVASRAGKGLKEPIVYSERLWSRNIDRAAQALAPLNRSQREIVLHFVDRVRNYQGMPEDLLRREARQNAAETMLDLAIGVGLLNETQIRLADGTSRPFLTTPHFYGDLEVEFGEDMCDRVKIFLDSTRNGQHFGHPWTGRILDPDRLLSRLLNSGEIGPCTAIGTDWVTSERAGIVVIRRSAPSSGQCYMKLVQKDVVLKVHEIVTKGKMQTDSVMEASHIREGRSFRSIEELRAEAGELPGDLAEAERAIIMKMRES